MLCHTLPTELYIPYHHKNLVSPMANTVQPLSVLNNEPHTDRGKR